MRRARALLRLVLVLAVADVGLVASVQSEFGQPEFVQPEIVQPEIGSSQRDPAEPVPFPRIPLTVRKEDATGRLQPAGARSLPQGQRPCEQDPPLKRE